MHKLSRIIKGSLSHQDSSDGKSFRSDNLFTTNYYYYVLHTLQSRWTIFSDVFSQIEEINKYIRRVT